MKKPIVGVMPLWDEEKESIWMLPGYIDGIHMAGALSIVFPFTTDREELEELVGLCDGILLTGGDDVAPELYGEERLENMVSCCHIRDEMEAIVLDQAIERNLSVLGICRGIQFINVHLGGTLYQDLPSMHSFGIGHHQSAPYDVPIHQVTILKDSPLYDLLGSERLDVNSYHHQAIKELSDQLEAMAYSPDGLVEAVRMKGQKFLWAVQWHPEFSYKVDESSRRIFRAFVSSLS